MPRFSMWTRTTFPNIGTRPRMFITMCGFLLRANLAQTPVVSEESRAVKVGFARRSATAERRGFDCAHDRKNAVALWQSESQNAVDARVVISSGVEKSFARAAAQVEDDLHVQALAFSPLARNRVTCLNCQNAIRDCEEAHQKKYHGQTNFWRDIFGDRCGALRVSLSMRRDLWKRHGVAESGTFSKWFMISLASDLSGYGVRSSWRWASFIFFGAS